MTVTVGHDSQKTRKTLTECSRLCYGQIYFT